MTPGYTLMNLNQLKIFYMAAKRGSLSAAAKDLYITQPAVTKAIQRLQEYYEVKFVNRFGKKMALTDAGQVLYGIAEKIFELESLAEDSIRDFQQQKRGHIRIDSSESFGAYYLPSIISPFSKSNPQVQVSVNILPTELVAQNTVDLKNDLGFISYPVENEKLGKTTFLSSNIWNFPIMRRSKERWRRGRGSPWYPRRLQKKRFKWKN